MCLIIRGNCKPEIAKEDITCWKMVVDWDKTKWMAPIRHTLHNYDEVLAICDRLEMEYYKGRNIIERGFHAYTNEKEAKYYTTLFPSRIMVKCTIPKGADYCVGKYNEIVANRMIVHKPTK